MCCLCRRVVRVGRSAGAARVRARAGGERVQSARGGAPAGAAPGLRRARTAQQVTSLFITHR